MNTTVLEKCDINRFDIHCYGRDVSINKCIFHNKANKFSSVYGRILFNKCVFIDFVPFAFYKSYNAYTKFSLIFNRCSIYTNKKDCSIVSAVELLNDSNNNRFELSKREWPDLHVNNLKVNNLSGIDRKVYIYYLDKCPFVDTYVDVHAKLSLKDIQLIPATALKILPSNIRTVNFSFNQ